MQYSPLSPVTAVPTTSPRALASVTVTPGSGRPEPAVRICPVSLDAPVRWTSSSAGRSATRTADANGSWALAIAMIV
jgi:hypothetical protein